MELIEQSSKKLAVIYRDRDWCDGIHFFTPHDWFVQAGTWQYEKDKILPTHKHQDNTKSTSRTQELIYVKRGAMELSIYDENLAFVTNTVLKKGDTAVLAFGGHSYRILEEGTQILEVKNGPFTGDDKVKPLT